VSEPLAEIQSLLGRYCWLVDHGEWEAWSKCFTPGGAFVTRGNRLEGRDEIVAYVKDELAAFSMIRHLSQVPDVELDEGGGSGRARSYFELRAVTRRGADTVALGSYVDTLELGEEGWQFAERVAEFEYWVKTGEPWGVPDDPGPSGK